MKSWKLWWLCRKTSCFCLNSITSLVASFRKPLCLTHFHQLPLITYPKFDLIIAIGLEVSTECPEFCFSSLQSYGTFSSYNKDLYIKIHIVTKYAVYNHVAYALMIRTCTSKQVHNRTHIQTYAHTQTYTHNTNTFSGDNGNVHIP